MVSVCTLKSKMPIQLTSVAVGAVSLGAIVAVSVTASVTASIAISVAAAVATTVLGFLLLLLVADAQVLELLGDLLEEGHVGRSQVDAPKVEKILGSKNDST